MKRQSAPRNWGSAGVFPALLVCAAGCQPAAPPATLAPSTAPPPAASSLPAASPPTSKVTPEEAAVVGAVREVLEHKDQAVPLEAPLGQPPVSADELDIVEIIMELEERLEIEIPDEELDRIAGTSETGELPKRITPRMLVELVRKAKPVKSPRGNRPSLRDGAPGQTGSTVRSSPSVS